MTLSGGFFNSFSGDRKYDALDFTRYLDGLVSNGSVDLPSQTSGTGLKVIPNPGQTAPSVIISSGKAFYDGMWAVNDADYVYSFGDQQVVPGIYYVLYLCFDTSDAGREVTFGHVTGTNPVLPTNNAGGNGKYYLELAKVADQQNIQPVEANINRANWLRAGVAAINVTTSSLENGAVTLVKLNSDTMGSNVASTVEALRKLGTGSTDAAAGDHTHDFASIGVEFGTANKTIVNATDVDLLWDSSVYHGGASDWYGGGAPDITIKTAGVYIITAEVEWAASNQDERRILRLQEKPQQTWLERCSSFVTGDPVATGAVAISQCLTYASFFDVNSLIKLTAYHATGANISITHGILSIFRIGA